MRRMDGNVMIALLGGLLLVAGCGSGGGNGATGGAGGASGKGGAGGSGAGTCQPFIPGDGTATWLANGVIECATITVAQHDVATLADTFEFVGSTTAGVGIGLTVSVYSGALGGTYTCKTDGGVGVAPYANIVYGGASSIDDCTITIDSAGTPGGFPARGTFSATGTTTSGPLSVTNGQFDTPVTTTGG